jgi:hypothetical protein
MLLRCMTANGLSCWNACHDDELCCPVVRPRCASKIAVGRPRLVLWPYIST